MENDGFPQYDPRDRHQGRGKSEGDTDEYKHDRQSGEGGSNVGGGGGEYEQERKLACSCGAGGGRYVLNCCRGWALLSRTLKAFYTISLILQKIMRKQYRVH